MGRFWTGNNRAPWHDYTTRRIYHLTLMKNPEVMPFGVLAGDWRLPAGEYGRSYIGASAIGKAIKDYLRDIRTIHPSLKVHQYALMPDHLHILFSVEDTPERFKPTAHDFGLCAQGRMLIVSLGMPLGTPLTRDVCLQMNRFAETICLD